MSEGANLDSGSFYSSYACYIGIGLSQICSKICPKCFQEFPKTFTYYASQSPYYACIMLLSCQQFLALS